MNDPSVVAVNDSLQELFHKVLDLLVVQRLFECFHELLHIILEVFKNKVELLLLWNVDDVKQFHYINMVEFF